MFSVAKVLQRVFQQFLIRYYGMYRAFIFSEFLTCTIVEEIIAWASKSPAHELIITF